MGVQQLIFFFLFSEKGGSPWKCACIFFKYIFKEDQNNYIQVYTLSISILNCQENV